MPSANPGQLRNQPPKSMRVNSFQLIKLCCTRTVPAAETKSIGLAADLPAGRQALVCHGFCKLHLDSFIVTRQFSFTYQDLVHLDSFIMTSGCSCVSQDLQKPRHRDADGNSPNRRAVMFKLFTPRQLQDNNITKA